MVKSFQFKLHHLVIIVPTLHPIDLNLHTVPEKHKGWKELPFPIHFLLVSFSRNFQAGLCSWKKGCSWHFFIRHFEPGSRPKIPYWGVKGTVKFRSTLKDARSFTGWSLMWIEKVTLISLSWRSLHLWKGHVFTIPKRSQQKLPG